MSGTSSSHRHNRLNKKPVKDVVTRFAPSPTGRLHLGHAYSALFACNQARDAGGRFILRIEDIDTGRCHPEYEEGIYEDLAWLGLEWEQPVRRQSDHLDDYRQALGRLEAQGLLYPCFCTRKEIETEIAASGSAPHGPEGPIYPGTCRHLSQQEQADKIKQGTPYALRLFVSKAVALLEQQGTWPLYWNDRKKGKQQATPEMLGDVVLARKDIPTSYHLSVTLDDHIQGITLVTRGEDLFYASHLHRLLQAILGLNVPEWHHHSLLLDEEGNRLAKRNKSITLQHLRENEQKSSGDIIAKLSRYLACFMLITGLGSTTIPQTWAKSEPPRVEDVAEEVDEAIEKLTEETVEEKQTKHLRESLKKNFFTVAVENDNFASGTDRNYTSGVRLSYYKANAHIPRIFQEIDPYIPVFNINDTTRIYWSIGQNLFTPEDTTLNPPAPEDRPYAGWIYGSAGLATTVDNVINELELTLGLVGDGAFGEETQSFTHSVFGIDEPEGWDSQLENEPGIILSWRRRWPDAMTADLGPLYLSLEPSTETALGNIYTYTGAGLWARISLFDQRWQDMPPRVRPAMPGTGYFGTPSQGGGWYLFAGAEGRAVARNIFLDGNTFKDSPSVDKKYLVADYTAGLALSWRDIRVSYSATYRSPEFEEDDTDLFGGITLTLRY